MLDGCPEFPRLLDLLLKQEKLLVQADSSILSITDEGVAEAGAAQPEGRELTPQTREAGLSSLT